MTLFEILSHDERVIVFSNEGEGIIITWNRSLTFQLYHGNAADTGYTDWEEWDIMTHGSKEPKNWEEARKIAQAWFGNYLAQQHQC